MGKSDGGEGYLPRLLGDIRALTEELRRCSERIREEIEETHRLAEITREEAARSRELSRSGRVQAEHVHAKLGDGRASRVEDDLPDPER